ncbi:unnamed protein product [Linum tenue]|uniref:Uncharacterized protein n=1 Tax=Linum tenue TaxID=586396 RepID=A0AAV0KHX7_9ROSI|nr:unnamed protein product [Linum tenue]
METLILLHPSPKLPPPPLLRPNLFHSPTTTTIPSIACFQFPQSTLLRRGTKSTRRIAPSASFRNGSDAPETGCPVPADQQPINEYQSLSTSFPFSWASGDIVEYCSRLFVTGASFALFVGLPVSWFGSVGPQLDPLKPIFAALSSGILVVSLAVLRMYLGWAYVGNRLLSATVEYEETGWYDGQIWVKTAEVLTRDRLLGSITVKPVLSRLKNTLVTLAVMLFVCVLLFINLEREANTYRLEEGRDRSVPGVYNDDSARSFEPDAFCGEPSSDVPSS